MTGFIAVILASCGAVLTCASVNGFCMLSSKLARSCSQ